MGERCDWLHALQFERYAACRTNDLSLFVSCGIVQRILCYAGQFRKNCHDFYGEANRAPDVVE